MVKMSVKNSWESLKDSIYILDETVMTNQIDLIQTMHGGITFISPELAQKVSSAIQAGDKADKFQKLVLFRFLISLAR